VYPSHPQTGSYSFVHTVSIEISLGFMQSKEAFPFLKIYVISSSAISGLSIYVKIISFCLTSIVYSFSFSFKVKTPS
jgi:hypothetical protein